MKALITFMTCVLTIGAFGTIEPNSTDSNEIEKKTAVQCEDIDVDMIVNKANAAAYYQGDDGKATVNMTITDSRGQKRYREFTVLRKDVNDGGDQNYYVYFLKPADVRKMVFMVNKHPSMEKDDDRWLYLPALDLVKRIAAGDKRTSFVGSDFLYEDVSGRSLDEDVHELVKSGEGVYVVRNIPKDADTVEFSYYNVTIDCNNFMPIKMEYYDKNDKLYRTIESLKIVNIQDFPTVVKSVVKDFKSGSTTEMEFSNIAYNIKLEDIFTERYLRRPPRAAVR